jgi:DNA-binding NarL/FixJ family response regulator
MFREGLSRLLREGSGLTLVGAADSWGQAREIAAREQPDVLIVDHQAAQLHEVDLAPLLQASQQPLKVIYLTLAENRMIVHEQVQVSDVTFSDLLKALQPANEARL